MTPRGELALGIDVGGTKIAVGVVTGDGEIIDRLLVPTPTDDKDANSILIMLAELVQHFRDRYSRIATVGVGAAGMVEWPDGFIRWAPNNSYRQLPLRAKLSELCGGIPTVVDNDANVAAWAEFRFNVARTDKNMLFLTVGTGVGGGIILDGAVYRGSSGIAGEIGHLIVDPKSGILCGCGNVGCLEAVASGTALERMGRAAAARDYNSKLTELAGSPERVTGKIIFEAADKGDPVASLLFEELGNWLGIGIASLVNVLDFDSIVLGGGLAAAGELLLVPTRDSFNRHVFGRPYRSLPKIRLSRFGEAAGLIGAATLALDTTVTPEHSACFKLDTSGTCAESISL